MTESNKKQKEMVDLHSVGLYVLSEETGTAELNAEFIDEFKEQFPQYVIEGSSDDLYDIIMPKLKELNKENMKANKQIHKWLLVLPSVMPLYVEDAAREETEYMPVHLNGFDEKGEEEEDEKDPCEKFTDMCSEFYNCQGVVFWDKNVETMKKFVKGLML
jgi:hypothetical protein